MDMAGAEIKEYNKETAPHIDYEWGTGLILCNGFTHLDWIENQEIFNIHDAISDTLTASILYTSKFVRATLKKRYRKHIVYVGSMAHNRVLNASSPYCAAKAGLAHFARCMAWELTPKGYVIATTHPGNIEGTPMTEKTIQGIMAYRGLGRKEAERYWSSALNADRFLNARDVAECISRCLQMEPQSSGAQIELGGGCR